MIGSRLHLLIGIIFRNAADTLPRALDSVLGQARGSYRVSILLVDDASTDAWRRHLGRWLRRDSVHVRSVELRSAAASRNFVLEEVERQLPDVDYIARLDADDTLADSTVLAELSDRLRGERPDVLLASNCQSAPDGRVVGINRPESGLRDPKVLLRRLDRMAQGDTCAELPSCNIVVRPHLPLRYPVVCSAEDHWYVVQALLDPTLRVRVAPELIYANYRLSGDLTTQNIERGRHQSSRRSLARFARTLLTEETLRGTP